MDNERNESGNVAESRKEVRIYTGAGGLSIEVLVESDRFWLNRQQLAKLFGRDVKTIGKHIANALKEELRGFPVVAKFATTAADGKTYQVAHYGFDISHPATEPSPQTFRKFVIALGRQLCHNLPRRRSLDRGRRDAGEVLRPK